LGTTSAALVERTFDKYAELIQDLTFPSVQRWKDEHRRAAVGYFPVYAPLELIHASGLLPVGLNGAGDQLDLQHADARFGSFICSIVKTTLEMGLTGHLDGFDGLLFSSICDSARNLCWVMKRNFPDKFVEFLHLPHNPSSPSSAEFLRGEYQRLLTGLEGIGGRPPGQDTLRASIRLYNRNRSLVRQLYALRSEAPYRLSTSNLYAVVRAGNFLPVEEHNECLLEALAHVSDGGGKPRDNIRVVVEGSFCEQPPLQLIKLIEQAGCYVVDDDFILGPRWFTEDVPLSGDPLTALAESYLDRAVCSSVRHDARKPRHKELVAKVRRNRAQAVILLIAKFCEPAYFDYVLYKRELEAAGIPHLLVEFEEKMFTFERLQNEVETFVESLLFD
jgi:benzoyl-CoA reductase subunit C